MRSDLAVVENQAVREVYGSYPTRAVQRLLELRELTLDVAAGFDPPKPVEETLKWGQPSYLTPGGSTVRLAWMASQPEQYFIFLNCNSSMIEVFREVFSGALIFEGKRAIVLNLEKPLPIEPIRACLEVALDYHRRKKQPSLGL